MNVSDFLYKTMIQDIKVSANLSREDLSELGKHKPYQRYIDFPVEVDQCICDITQLIQAGCKCGQIERERA